MTTPFLLNRLFPALVEENSDSSVFKLFCNVMMNRCEGRCSHDVTVLFWPLLVLQYLQYHDYIFFMKLTMLLSPCSLEHA